MNKKTKALTTEQYKEIIQTMKEGFCGCRPNERIATALVLEGNLGLRISDILSLRLCDIVMDGDRYRLEIVEQKTGKKNIYYNNDAVKTVIRMLLASGPRKLYEYIFCSESPNKKEIKKKKQQIHEYLRNQIPFKRKSFCCNKRI